MSNTSRRKGFALKNQENARLSTMFLKAGNISQDGDVGYLGSDGYPTTRNSAYPIIGAQVGGIFKKEDLTVLVTATDGDFAIFTDPREDHVGEIADGNRTDPFTTWTTSAAFDVAGAAGAKYINQATSVYNEIQVLGPSHESNGVMSAYDTNQKVVFRFTPANIMPVHSNYEQLQ